jgi:hypothetical protein
MNMSDDPAVQPVHEWIRVLAPLQHAKRKNRPATRERDVENTVPIFVVPWTSPPNPWRSRGEFVGRA